MSEAHADATQITGMVAFALAAAVCALAAAARGKTQQQLWRALLASQLAFCAEALFGVRYRLHDAVDAVLQSLGMYASRTGLQIALIVVALGLVAASLPVALRWWRRGDRAAAGAIAGALLGGGVFAIDTISLHDVDAIMYAFVGPIKTIGWLWAGVAAIVAISALRAARR